MKCWTLEPVFFHLRASASYCPSTRLHGPLCGLSTETLSITVCQGYHLVLVCIYSLATVIYEVDFILAGIVWIGDGRILSLNPISRSELKAELLTLDSKVIDFTTISYTCWLLKWMTKTYLQETKEEGIAGKWV